ncbi:MAG TPA: penicillin-binding protein 2 [Fimbriimonadaceae bacterium]|nr:penicillin-binding protein 2 [Fimbriimonadaceae bacterium]HRJ33082.1 penicillin-binding protein 2 [Fimbriimonadaceae bacterium]
MSVIHTERQIQWSFRVLIFPVALGLFFVACLLRLWYLQVAAASELQELADIHGSVEVERLAPRGLMTDRNGKMIAGIKPALVITGVPNQIRKNPHVLDQLSSLLGVSRSKLQDKLDQGNWRPYLPTPLYVGATMQQASRIAEMRQEWPGLDVESQSMRFYPDTYSLTHVLGYVWTPNEKDVKRLESKGMKPAQYVGKVGLEYVYEAQLMGQPGKDRMDTDARGRPIRNYGEERATPGERMVLSIDIRLQKAAMNLLRGRRGAVVALDPATGEVLCLVSAPSYNTDLFSSGISREDFARLQADKDLPQINRAISTPYAPGSTFKIVTAIAAAMQGKFSPRQTAHCAGYYEVGNRKFRCLGRHGDVSFNTAFAKSCNAYFADLGVRAGVEGLRSACDVLGLGQRTGIDLIGEQRGIVPTDEWIRRWRDPPKWYTGDTVNFSVGQGEISTTPIQMATLAMLVANRGTAYRPHLVRAWVPANPTEKGRRMQPEILHRIDLPASFWDSLEGAMASVVDFGTAGKAKIPGLRWGGKTGSAENRRDKETHSWFVGVAPLDDPKIALAVVVENAGHGGDVAAPLASQIVRRYLRPQGVEVELSSIASSRPAASASAAREGASSSR